MRLADKTVIVTGAGRGIGRDLAAAFAAEGASVIVAEVDESSGRAAADELTRTGATAHFVHTDVGDPGSVEALVATTMRDHGRIDVLVNNAAVSLGGTILDTSFDVWSRTIAVNQTGAFLCSQHVARAMVEAGTPGRIISLASVNSFAAESGAASYVASKGAVLALTRSMAVDLAPHGILVNAIAPGPIRTETTAAMFDEPAYREGIRRGIPLGRSGSGQEVARGAVFLASEESSFVTGSALVIDGGYLAYARLD